MEHSMTSTTIAAAPSDRLGLGGVHHTARPTWKLRETVAFYRDVMGLPLVHAISARGWGPDDHADFLHFFFDSGNGSTIAFFYYIGTERPDYLADRDDYQYRATHTSWQVQDAAALAAWRRRFEEQGVKVHYQVRHEIIESIYVSDPNGYMVEITIPLRPMDARDAADAGYTIEAAMVLEDADKQGQPFAHIDQVWHAKAARLEMLMEVA
jgi:catechol 2,3-dioxygenase-like lactoylglutathione lyase family enzyme